MADFENAFKRMLDAEGLSLTNDPADHGKQTFGGVSRRYNPTWIGWSYVDRGAEPPMQLLREFYEDQYWNAIKGDSIQSQRVAEAVFSQFVNMGANAIKLAQTVVGTIADGKLGGKTLYALNAMDEDRFLMLFCIANIARYHAIGMKDKTQRKFWPGWIRRSLSIVS